jgi:phenolic acid decarboxylase
MPSIGWHECSKTFQTGWREELTQSIENQTDLRTRRRIQAAVLGGRWIRVTPEKFLNIIKASYL